MDSKDSNGSRGTPGQKSWRELSSDIFGRLFFTAWAIFVVYQALETLDCDTMIRAGGSSGGGGSSVMYCVEEGAQGNLSPTLAAATLFAIAAVLLFFTWIYPMARWVYGRIRSRNPETAAE